MALGGTAKIVAGVVGTGVAGSTGVGCYFLFKQPTPIAISKLIEQEHKNKAILDSSNKAKGVAIWKKYKSDNANKPAKGDTWKINGWPVTESTVTEAHAGLISACQERKTKEVKDNKDQEYLNFVDWCLVDK